MGWIIATVCLGLICIALGWVVIKQGDAVDAQMEVLRDQQKAIDVCFAAWGKLRLVPQVSFMMKKDGIRLEAISDNPALQAEGQRAVDDLHVAIEEIKGLKRKH
jgi:hypothetical protein